MTDEVRDVMRLMRPRSVAVVGGGAWCTQVVQQLVSFGFDGPIWPVHPRAAMVAGLGAYPSVADLPAPPDATFVGVNRVASVDVVRALAGMGAGGAVCFASGFAEAEAEDAAGVDMQAALVAAAGAMPILGPNCYGFINALDGALLWPDQHGCVPVERGVALLTQSSNIAINLTMQQRALPVAYAVTCGNMAQTSQAQIATALLDDPRVTAIGLHIEGFGDVRQWEALAARAHEKGVPLVAIKVGASDQARAATVSHTASLAGSDAGAQAFLDRLGIPRVRSLPELLETLKLLHVTGPLAGGRIASISCSGGEASLIADMALDHGLTFPALDQTQTKQLRAALGPMVALSNPLDYHTYVWRDTDAMTRAWLGMTGAQIDMTLSIVDYPVTDASDWSCATDAALNVRRATERPFGVVSTLPELMPRDTAETLMAGGVVPFFGLAEALAALDAARQVGAPHEQAVALPGSGPATETLSEASAKAALAAHGVIVPAHRTATPHTVDAAVAALSPPFAIKGTGLAHKTEAGAVRLGVTRADAARVATEIGTRTVLIEEMITDGVAELLIGVTRDPAHGYVLTLGAGGVLTEVLKDTVSLLCPATASDIAQALEQLACAPLLRGYRGQPAADMTAITDTVLAVQDYVLAQRLTVSEVEINPLICTPHRAVAVDALIRMARADDATDTDHDPLTQEAPTT
ncbi:acetate--CoA ligase family protein [uncultured Tateyamaria sp.]|uniref:acetate--CoA ligase family protein n=1 Tax=uncultured Tateyamaria sp. TaxID=455651 RepID=UPI00262A0E3E|nr:acetate--CoA ligase family protein [uncultured Tateyamaria sp.]